MKIKSLITAFALALVFSATATAQNSNDRPADCPLKQQCQVDSSCPRVKLNKKSPMCPMQGIELSDAQKAKFSELCNNCDKQGKHRGSCPDEKCLEEVKKILTPEQYVTFLENAVKQKANRPDPRRMHHKGPRYQKHPQQ